MLERGRHAFEKHHGALGRQRRLLLRHFLISATACLMRVIAGCDFQPNAWRRKRALKLPLVSFDPAFVHRAVCNSALAIAGLLYRRQP